MSVQVAQCAACGKDVEVKVPDLFGSATGVVTTCTECAFKEHLEAGGQVAVVELEDPIWAVFSTSLMVVSPGAVKALAEAGQEAKKFLIHHVAGEWGKFGDLDDVEITDEERKHGSDKEPKANRIAVESGNGRVFSVFKTAKDVELWVMTTLNHGRGETTILLPEEY